MASQYLVQALQALQNQAPAQPAMPSMSPEQMAAIAQKAKAYQAIDPGGSFIGHNLMQAGRNLMGVPGQAMDGLQTLAQRFGGGPGSAPY